MADINSPEHKAALAARRAQGAHGPHIREKAAATPPPTYDVTPGDPPVDVQALGLQVDALTDMLSKLTLGMNAAKATEDADVQLPKPKFDGTVSWGNILVLLGFAISAALGYANQQQTNAHFEDALKQNSVEIARVRADGVADVARVRAEGDARATHYAPMIETSQRLNEAQAASITSLGESMRQLRDIVSDLAKAQTATDRALAVWIAQHERDMQPGPRG